MKRSSFDTIAEAYYSSTPNIPQEYIKLLQETFHISSEDRIIDLGCGSGDLALTFANKTSFVEGLDASKTMISMAEEKDKDKKVKWIHKNTEDFDLGQEKYDLIFSYESFHLFRNHKKLIKQCARALKPGKYLGLGWVVYEWDIPLKDAIYETFAKYGIARGEWGLWTCPQFAEDVQEATTELAIPEKKELKISTQTPIHVIVNYILSISKSASLNEEIKAKIARDLEKRFLEIYPSGKSDGYTVYSLVFSKRKD